MLLRVSSIDTFESDDLTSRVHDSRISTYRPANGILRVVHVDDDDLRRFTDFLTDTDKLVRFHG